MRPARLIAIAAIVALAALPARAGEALVAVAANFLETAEAVAAGFEAETGHEIRLTAGSTGKLYAQIVAGAPFDVFLSADAERPRRLEEEGLAIPGSRFTYATGRLALWSADEGRIGSDGRAALEDDFRALAIANPDLAPYGMAAREALEALGLWDAVGDRIVMGQNVGQAFALVATGNAELGLVALAALRSPSAPAGGSAWIVPAGLHAPIRQDAVLLTRAAENAAAAAFLEHLKRAETQALVARYGYGG